MWVKICGVTSREDAAGCVDAGADAIGFNFWPRSKRYRPRDVLAPIARAVRGRIERFGVFVDPTAEEIQGAFDDDLIDVAQLHGDEDAALCHRFAGRCVKALRLAGEHSLGDFARYPGERFLIDAPFAGYGGSGALVDEALARRAVLAAPDRHLILAGGLTADNLAAVARGVLPWGVDVASGVERAPGVKELELVRRFVAAARSLP